MEVRRLMELLAEEKPTHEKPQSRLGVDYDFAAVLRSDIERSAAPIIAKNTLLAMLDEAQVTTQWVRRTFWIAAVSLIVSIASILIVLFHG